MQPRTHGAHNHYYRLPEERSGYAFDWGHSWWSTIVPEESTNLIINPSFENLVSSVEADEYLLDSIGAYNLEYIDFPSVGATAGHIVARLSGYNGAGWLYYYQGLTCGIGPNSFSLDAYVDRPCSIELGVYNTSDEPIVRRRFDVDRPGWKRYALTYYAAAAITVEPRLTVHNNSGSLLANVYTDAWQFETKAYPTTYIDGDMVAFDDTRPFESYYWHGIRHGSPSTRAATANDGGRVVSWTELADFMTTSVMGLSGMPVEIRTQIMANGMEVNTGSIVRARDFSIVGKIFGRDPADLFHRHNELMGLLRPNNVLGNKPIKLRYQQVNPAGTLVGKELDIMCAYSSGLQGTINDLHQETLPLQFRASQPYLLETLLHGQEMEWRKSLVSNGVFYRNEDGDYVNLGVGTTNAYVLRVGFLRDGSPLAVGNFTQLAGVAIDNVGIWNGTTWIQAGATPPTNIVDLDTGYRFGYNPIVATTSGVFEYDPIGDSWTQLGGTFDATIHAIQRDINGNIWAGGDFVNIAGSPYNGIAKWDYTSELWVDLNEGVVAVGSIPGTVRSLFATDDGIVYISGDFYAMENPPSETVFGTKIARWNDNTLAWENLNAESFDDYANHIVQGKDGYLYFTGPFVSNVNDTLDLRGAARFNGSRMEEPFQIINVDGLMEGAMRMFTDQDGIVWFMGSAVNEYAVSDTIGATEFFGWRDGMFYPPFADNTLGMRDMSIGPGGRAIFATYRYDSLVNLRVPALNTIEYTGTADTPLILYVRGRSTPRFAENLDTKGGVHFRPTFTLGENETLTVRNDGKRALVYTDGRSSVHKFVLSGLTKLGALRLRPGRNRISTFMVGNVGDASVEWAEWKNAHWGLGGAIDE